MVKNIESLSQKQIIAFLDRASGVAKSTGIPYNIIKYIEIVKSVTTIKQEVVDVDGNSLYTFDDTELTPVYRVNIVLNEDNNNFYVDLVDLTFEEAVLLYNKYKVLGGAV